ncbi:DUF4012 domain-containing protein [Nocardioides korecus]
MLIGVLTLVVLLLVLVAWQGWSAYRSAEDADVAVREFRTRLLDRDVTGARESLDRAQTATQDARSSLSGPQWTLVGAVPGVGDDVSAAQSLVSTVDDVTHGAMPAVLTALSDVDPRKVGLRDGRVQLAPLQRASAQLTRAASLLGAADRQAAAITTRSLIPKLATKVEATQKLLDQTSRLSRTAAVAGRLLPGMLGQGGRRDYLLLAQNTAEQRSLGGIPGAIALIRAENGRLTLVKQATATDIGSFDRPVLPLAPAEQALYGTVLATYPQNVTDTPDFPRAAQLITAMWQRREGGRVDGVAAIDPWALQLLLRAVGPVPTSAGRLTGKNATQKLLVDVYRDVPDPQQQNQVFAQAAKAVFDRVRQFRGDPRALTTALSDGVEQGRVMVWSARADEERILATTALGRSLRSRAAQSDVGVYFHDRTQSKMSTYQRAAITSSPSRCTTPTSATVTVKVRSAAPKDRNLPPYVTGGGARVRPGDVLTQVVVYAPRGWTIQGVRASDGRRDLTTYRHDGLWAGTRDFELAPGESKTLTVRMGGVALRQIPDIRYTPGTKPANVLLVRSGCS